MFNQTYEITNRFHLKKIKLCFLKIIPNNELDMDFIRYAILMNVYFKQKKKQVFKGH